VIRTKLCDMLGIEHPIIQAGMGPFDTSQLAAAVADAGALGIISHWGILTEPHVDSATKMRECIKYVKEHSRGNFGVNIRVARLQVDAPAVLQAVLEAREREPEVRERLKLVITSAGDPRPAAEEIRKSPGLLHFHVAPSLYHATRVEQAGCHGIIATGYEGGGHQSYEQVSTFVLIPEVVKAARIPVVAGGGICDGSGLAAALAIGAAGIQMGTRFIATQECEFHQNYKDLVLASKDTDTVVVQGAFGPVRLLENSYSLAAPQALTKELRIAQEKEMFADVQKWLDEMAKYELIYRGDTENGPVLCGEVAGAIANLPTVRELIEGVVAEAEQIMMRLPQNIVR